MSDHLFMILIYFVAPGILGLGAFLMRSQLNRLDALEKEMPDKTSKEEVRQLLIDRIEPIREDIHDLKSKLDKIIDFLMKQ